MVLVAKGVMAGETEVMVGKEDGREAGWGLSSTGLPPSASSVSSSSPVSPLPAAAAGSCSVSLSSWAWLLSGAMVTGSGFSNDFGLLGPE